jgi:hypothetical protein
MGIRPTRAGATLLVAALAATGCGTGVNDDGHVQARSAVETFLRLCGQQRGRELAAVLNGPALDAFMRSGDIRLGCATILRQPVALPAGAYARARVTGAATAGDQGRIAVALPGGTRTAVEAERESDRWWVTSPRLRP